jgi:hypothetical protein
MYLAVFQAHIKGTNGTVDVLIHKKRSLIACGEVPRSTGTDEESYGPEISDRHSGDKYSSCWGLFKQFHRYPIRQRLEYLDPY